MVYTTAFIHLLIAFLTLADGTQAAAVGRKPNPRADRRTKTIRVREHNGTITERGYDGTSSSDPWVGFQNFNWSPWNTWGFNDHDINYVK